VKKDLRDKEEMSQRNLRNTVAKEETYGWVGSESSDIDFARRHRSVGVDLRRDRNSVS
jgi:hypothetical protein